MRTLYVIFSLLLLSACVKDDLERSIFIRDPEHPELPGYSEWGLNTFGAFIDREPFISNAVEVPAKVSIPDGKTTLLLAGQKGLDYVTYSPRHPAFAIRFVIPVEAPETYHDLVNLHNSSWDLTHQDALVIMSEGARSDTLKIFSGSLHFIRAQQLLVDQTPKQVILSGVFEFKASLAGSPVSVTMGRFDVGVGEHNFFSY